MNLSSEIDHDIDIEIAQTVPMPINNHETTTNINPRKRVQNPNANAVNPNPPQRRRLTRFKLKVGSKAGQQPNIPNKPKRAATPPTTKADTIDNLAPHLQKNLNGTNTEWVNGIFGNDMEKNDDIYGDMEDKVATRLDDDDDIVIDEMIAQKMGKSSECVITEDDDAKLSTLSNDNILDDEYCLDVDCTETKDTYRKRWTDWELKRMVKATKIVLKKNECIAGSNEFYRQVQTEMNVSRPSKTICDKWREKASAKGKASFLSQYICKLDVLISKQRVKHSATTS